MIISIILTLIWFVLMMIEDNNLNRKIEYLAFMVTSAISVWGNYILNALEK